MSDKNQDDEIINSEENARLILQFTAHELVSHLVYMKNSISRHRAYPEKFNLDNTFRDVESTIDLALAMTEGLMQFSVSRKDQKISQNFESINVSLFLRNLTKSMKNYAENYGFSIKNIFIYVDPVCKNLRIGEVQLRAIFFNLISNAIKYSSGKNDEKWCKVFVGVKNNKLIISVRNDGFIIENAYKEKIFHSGFRAAGDYSIRGSGLGLTIVKNVVDAMEGVISIRSKQIKKDMGTTEFLIELSKNWIG